MYEKKHFFCANPVMCVLHKNVHDTSQVVKAFALVQLASQAFLICNHSLQ